MNKLSVDMRVCIGARKDTSGSKKELFRETAGIPA